MTQTPEGEASSSAIERAEKILSRAGEQFGVLVWRSRRRFQQAAQTLHEPVSHQDTPVSASVPPKERITTAHHLQENHPASERAEELVDQFGQHASHWVIENSLRARRTLARLREDAEDVFVEAQEMHNEWKGQHTQGEDERRAFTR